jgi:hypothetical protein
MTTREPRLRIELRPSAQKCRVYVGDTDISHFVRSAIVTMRANEVTTARLEVYPSEVDVDLTELGDIPLTAIIRADACAGETEVLNANV